MSALSTKKAKEIRKKQKASRELYTKALEMDAKNFGLSTEQLLKEIGQL